MDLFSKEGEEGGTVVQLRPAGAKAEGFPWAEIVSTILMTAITAILSSPQGQLETQRLVKKVGGLIC
jgi:hypothetical protein